MQLTLEDATGEVDANLFDVDGEAFFQVRCTSRLQAAQSLRQTPARVTVAGTFSPPDVLRSVSAGHARDEVGLGPV